MIFANTKKVSKLIKIYQLLWCYRAFSGNSHMPPFLHAVTGPEFRPIVDRDLTEPPSSPSHLRASHPPTSPLQPHSTVQRKYNASRYPKSIKAILQQALANAKATTPSPIEAQSRITAARARAKISRLFPSSSAHVFGSLVLCPIWELVLNTPVLSIMEVALSNDGVVRGVTPRKEGRGIGRVGAVG